MSYEKKPMDNNSLQVKTHARPNSRLAIEVEVPQERCKTSYDLALTRLSGSVKLPGFRKGKVPKAVLIQQIGLIRIRASALENLLEKVWQELIDQKSIEPLCEPEIQEGFEELLKTFSPDQNLTFTFETDINPTPKLKATKDLIALVQEKTFDLNKVDALIEESRKQLSTLVPVEDRPAEKQDLAVISFSGTFKDDGSEIEGGKSESMDVDLENSNMIPGFVQGIVGMKPGDTKTLECQFPEDYPNKDAQGRKADFVVTLKDLKMRST